MNLTSHHIFINATATQPGGGYTILMQFLKAYTEHPLPDTDVYVFNSTGIGEDMSSYSCIKSVNMPKLNGFQRVYWDWKGMKEWSVKHNITPALILSFQNTGVRFGRVPQMIYLQQSIPFAAHQWNILKKAERSLWMYKNIYPLFIAANLFRYTYLVVQTAWMKQAFLKRFPRHDPQKVFVFSPDVPDVNAANEIPGKTCSGHKFSFFYPATRLVYKNHIEIIKAFASIKKKSGNWDAKCYLTLSVDELTEEARYLIKTYELYSNFVFLGTLSLQEVYSYYRKADALIFPSYIETIGLPLIESAGFGMPILVADEPYSREVLSGYNNVLYAKTGNTDDWENKIIEIQKFKKVHPQKIALSGKSWPDMIRLLGTLIKN